MMGNFGGRTGRKIHTIACCDGPSDFPAFRIRSSGPASPVKELSVPKKLLWISRGGKNAVEAGPPQGPDPESE